MLFERAGAFTHSLVVVVLSVFQAALTTSTNFKVRIAAAKALSTVPSRQGFRIPTLSQHVTAQLSCSDDSDGLIITQSANNGLFTESGSSSSSSSHLSPALQMPGYDAFPPVFGCLLQALEMGGSNGSGADFLEYKYRHALMASVRAALLHLVLLAEKLDYGRMKALIDTYAEFLFTWLCAEEALLSSPTIATTDPGLPAAASAPSAATGPFSGMLAQPGIIGLDVVHAAFRALTALFDSRVKTIPKPLLSQFHAKVLAAAAT
jgi:hypothetical protein